MNVTYNNDGLVPVIIQHHITNQVLMLGYMNEEALKKTQTEGRVTFFSRSKNRLWTKGETSGNFLIVNDIKTDCDNDTLLIVVKPLGNVCHRGTKSCFNNDSPKCFIYDLEDIISEKIDNNAENSYSCSLYKKGINKIAQKVGEEAIELVIESKDDNIVLFKNEAADLLYHFLVLLKAKNIKLENIEEVLSGRNIKVNNVESN